jgi:hypothetical protein
MQPYRSPEYGRAAKAIRGHVAQLRRVVWHVSVSYQQGDRPA